MKYDKTNSEVFLEIKKLLADYCYPLPEIFCDERYQHSFFAIMEAMKPTCNLKNLSGVLDIIALEFVKQGIFNLEGLVLHENDESKKLYAGLKQYFLAKATLNLFFFGSEDLNCE